MYIKNASQVSVFYNILGFDQVKVTIDVFLQVTDITGNIKGNITF